MEACVEPAKKPRKRARNRERTEAHLQCLIDRTSKLEVVQDDPEPSVADSKSAVTLTTEAEPEQQSAPPAGDETCADEAEASTSSTALPVAEQPREEDIDDTLPPAYSDAATAEEEGAVTEEVVAVTETEISWADQHTAQASDQLPPPIPMHRSVVKEAESSSVGERQTSIEQKETTNEQMAESAVPSTSTLNECPAYEQPAIASYPVLPKPAAELESPATAPPAYQLPQQASAPLLQSDACTSGQQERLLSEEQLRSFYLNERLEIVDDLILGFVQNEISPVESDPLFGLLAEYCEQTRRLDGERRGLAQMHSDCQRAQANLWVTNKKLVKHTGECQCRRAATAQAEIETSEYQSASVGALRRALEQQRHTALKQHAQTACTAESTRLQCCWLLESCAEEFLHDNNVQEGDADVHILFSAGPDVRDRAARVRLRYCVTVLFYHLRLPNVAPAFVDNVKCWILKVCSTLLRRCTEFDQLFVVCHVLRCGVPVEDWAVGLLRPVTACAIEQPAQRRAQVDHFLVILYLLTTPVSKREEFLSACLVAAAADQSWTELDDEGEDVNAHLQSLRDEDLVALVGQCSFEHLYAAVFDLWNTPAPPQQADVLCVFAFQLTVMKLIYDGLQTYNRPSHVQFCKRLTHLLRQSVRFVADYWAQCCERAVAVQMRLDVWPFLVDIPCARTSETCRDRIRLLLRSPSAFRMSVLCAMRSDEMQPLLADDTVLVCRVRELSDTNAVCMLSALCHIAILGQDTSASLECLRQLFHVCFVEPSTRETLCKIGAECVGRMVETVGGAALTHTLKLMDRNADQMLELVPTVLSQTRLAVCRPTESDLHLIGKWLINKRVEHELNATARRVICALNWSPQSGSVHSHLYLPQSLHTVAAEVIQSAHRQHCSQQNGLLVASVKKASKLALRIPDGQQQFDGFCWQILMRLKLPADVSESSADVAEDTTSFYVRLITGCVHDWSTMESVGGVRLLAGLLDAGCFGAACVTVGELMKHCTQTEHPLLTNNNTTHQSTLCACVDRCVHADQSALAQLYTCLTGDSALPADNKYLTLVQAAICHSLPPDADNFISAAVGWCRLLIGGRPEWNADASVLCLLDTLIQRCAAYRPAAITALVPVLQAAYQTQLEAHRQAGRGVLNWIAGAEPVAPPLIRSAQMGVAPWFAYIAIQVEADAWKAVHDKLVQVMLKHNNMSLEQALKKTVTKLAMSYAIERLCFYRWLDLIGCLAVEHSLLPLACQQLAINLLRRHKTPPPEHKPVCLGQRLMRARCTESKFASVKASLERARQHWTAQRTTTGGDPLLLADYYASMVEWLWDARFYTTDQPRPPANSPLDFLLHLIISDDCEPWLNYVNVSVIELKQDRLLRCFRELRHLLPVLTRADTQANSRDAADTSSALIALRERAAQPDVSLGVRVVRAQPPLSKHSPPYFDAALLGDANRLMQTVQPRIRVCVQAANKYVAADDRVSLLDAQLLELTAKLYHSVTIQVPVSLRCSSTLIHSCNNPRLTNAQAEVMRFSTSTENEIGENRNSRRQELAAFEAELLEELPLNVAVLHVLCRHLSNVPAVDQLSGRPAASEAGITLFYHLISSTSPVTRSFPLTNHVFGQLLQLIGQRYVSGVAGSQEQLLDVMLQRADLSDLLLANFSPNILPPPAFISMYSRLLTAFRSRSQRTPDSLVVALCNKIELASVFDRFPAQDAHILLPMILQLCAAARAHNCDPLQQLAVAQFVHASLARFPAFINEALRLLMQGYGTEQPPPPAILRVLNERLADCATDGGRRAPACPINALLADELLATLAGVFAESRSRLGGRLLSHWAQNIEQVVVLLQLLFERLLAGCELRQHACHVESELQRVFSVMTALFGVWLEPGGGNGQQAAWAPDDTTAANQLLAAFVNCLASTHQHFKQHSAGDNVVCHMLLYYASRYAGLRGSAAHCHAAYNEHFVRLPWHTLCPGLPAIDAMQKCLSDGAEECRPLLVNICVRVDWLRVAEQQRQHEPAAAARMFHSMLLDVLCRAAAKSAYYVDCRASLPELLDRLLACDWWLVEPAALQALTTWLAANYDVQCLLGGGGGGQQQQQTPQTAALRLVRAACQLQRPTADPGSSGLTGDQLHARQCLYIELVLRLLARAVNNSDRAEQTGELMQAYCQLCLITDDVLQHMHKAGQTTRSGMYGVTSALLRFWAELTWNANNGADPRNTISDACVSAFCTWLLDHPDRPLVLLVTHDLVPPDDQPPAHRLPVALKLMDNALRAYFMSGRPSLTWPEVLSYARVGCGADALMQLPVPVLLPLHAALQPQLQEGKAQLLLRLAAYVQSLRPSDVHEEASLLLIVHDLLTVFVAACRSTRTEPHRRPLYDAVQSTLQCLVVGGKQQTSLFSAIGLAKRPLFSARLRLVCAVVRLYLEQQSVSGTGPSVVVRMAPDEPVMNARIQAAVHLLKEKTYAPFAQCVSSVHAYFSDVHHHTGDVPELCASLCRALYIERYLHALQSAKPRPHSQF